MPHKDKSNSSDVKYGWFTSLFQDIFDIGKGVNQKATIEKISSEQSMTGANAWMLICSIMIASIGLNLDSQAVIIGAMLISPLMSPILGIGLGVAINDKDALYHALTHFASAIVIALVTSTFYFLITPLDEFTYQIESRTEPTFLDVFIAIFGGIAGIISIARKDISTTLPGVAIATALMPPLCVAGYGIANASWFVATKAFYLFFLNSFFVAFATYVILKRMHFPKKVITDLKQRRRNIIFVSIFIILTIIPSLFIFWSVYEEFTRNQKLKQFIVNNFEGRSQNLLDEYKLVPPENPTELLIKVYGTEINDSSIEGFKQGLKDVGLGFIKDIEIISTTEIDLNNFDELRTQVSGLDEKLNAQINQLIDERHARETVLHELTERDNFFRQDSVKFKRISQEAKIFFPDIQEMSLAVSQSSDFKKATSNLPTLILKWRNPKEDDIKKLERFIKESYAIDTLKTVRYN